MLSFSGSRYFAVIAGLLFLPLNTIAAPVASQPSFPTLIYWDNWTDQNGISHLTKCRITAFRPLHQPSAPKAGTPVTPKRDSNITTRQDNAQALIWDGIKRDRKGYATVATIVQPPGWTGKWENSVHVQWTVPVAGTYFVQAMDGTRVELNPGDILLNEDIGSVRDKNGHQGHLSGNVGREAVALITTRFEVVDRIAHKPCTRQ